MTTKERKAQQAAQLAAGARAVSSCPRQRGADLAGAQAGGQRFFFFAHDVVADDDGVFEFVCSDFDLTYQKEIQKEEAYYFERKEEKNPNDDIDFDYRKGEEKDEMLIKKMKDIFEVYDCERLKELYLKTMEFREKLRGKGNFQYMKDLDYDVMVKEELRKMFGKYFYLEE